MRSVTVAWQLAVRLAWGVNQKTVGVLSDDRALFRTESFFPQNKPY